MLGVVRRQAIAVRGSISAHPLQLASSITRRHVRTSITASTVCRCFSASPAAAAFSPTPVAAPLPPPPASPKKPKKSTLRILRADARGWEVVIGIEVHAQITAVSKLFSGASTQFGASPNAHTSLIDCASPGTLPILNAHSVDQAIRTGLGLGGEVQRVSRFERKHYFYADMPQGYQITQQQFPIIRGGVVTLSSGDSSTPSRSIRITRIQLEQDSGKSLHDLHPTRSFVDFNRAGVGLMEIVSEPDMRTSDEAVSYIRKLSSLLQALGTCRAHMEEGSLRADVNISIRRPGGEYGERVEVKNLNSLRSLQRAIEHEVSRQIALSTAGQPVRRETRSFDAKTGETALLRAKEQLLDYRFAPEPDLPPLILQPSHISSLHASLPELPAARFQRFRTEYSLTEYDAGVLLAEQGAAEYMDRLVYGEEGWKGGKVAQRMIRSPKKCANWLANELFGRLKKMKQSSSNSSPDDDLDVDDGLSSDWPGSFLGGGSRSPSLSSSPITSAALGELVDLVEEGKISGKVGKEVMEVMMRPLVEGEVRKTPAQIVRENGWAQVTDDALIARLCEEVVAKFPEEVQAVLGGNKRLFGFLSGQVLKLSGSKEAGEKNSGSGGGKLNPAAVSKRLTQVIEEKRAAK